MILPHIKNKIKGLKGITLNFRVFWVLFVILAFILGKLSLSEAEKQPILVVSSPPIQSVEKVEKSEEKAQISDIVASKSGTKYYFVWCSGVSRIKAENRVYFENIEEARGEGLEPAKNCAGLE